MEQTRLYIIRHGEVVGHHELRYNGHHDVDITEKGIRQMELLADYLEGESIEAVYSSDLKRALKGASIIGERLGLSPVPLRSLRELHLGRWEGLTREEAVERFPEEADFSFSDLATSRVKGGESLIDLRERVLPAVCDVEDRHRGGRVCLVLHGGVNRVILCEAMGLAVSNFFRIEQDYGGLSIIDTYVDGTRVVKMLNGGPNQDMNMNRPY